MNSGKLILNAVIVAVILTTFATSSQAITQRAFVSGTGDDINIASDCPRTSPCRTFNVAIGAVIAGGELIALDTAGYGGIVNINKEITIAAIPGEMALVAVSAGTDGFTVNAGAGETVLLRNITFNGTNAANTTGVQHNSGNLVVDNCTFMRLTFAGLSVNFGASSRIINVNNSIFLANLRGLTVNNGAVNTENCNFTRNSTAIVAEGQGPDQDPFIGVTPRLTVVRVSNGVISSNGLGFSMINPGVAGTRAPAGCNAQNIFVRDLDGTGNGQPNMVGNSVFLSVSGLSDFNGSCSFPVIGSYSSQPNTLVANQ